MAIVMSPGLATNETPLRKVPSLGERRSGLEVVTERLESLLGRATVVREAFYAKAPHLLVPDVPDAKNPIQSIQGGMASAFSTLCSKIDEIHSELSAIEAGIDRLDV